MNVGSPLHYLILVAGFVFGDDAARAGNLECNPVPPSINAAHAVFYGHVIAARYDSARAALFARGFRGPPIPADSVDLFLMANKGRFAVDSVWKGIDSTEVTIFSDPSGEGVHFEVGAKYLVIANLGPGKVLVTSQCDGTRVLPGPDDLPRIRKSLLLGRSHPPRHRPLPRFEDFPAPTSFSGRPAPVDLSSREAQKFRTVLRDGSPAGPNFAGHFTIVTWACGSNCHRMAIVDAADGRVVFVDSSLHLGASFRLGSELLITDPEEMWTATYGSLASIAVGGNATATYYRWNGRRLVSLDSLCIGKEMKC